MSRHEVILYYHKMNHPEGPGLDRDIFPWEGFCGKEGCHPRTSGVAVRH